MIINTPFVEIVLLLAPAIVRGKRFRYHRGLNDRSWLGGYSSDFLCVHEVWYAGAKHTRLSDAKTHALFPLVISEGYRTRIKLETTMVRVLLIPATGTALVYTEKYTGYSYDFSVRCAGASRSVSAISGTLVWNTGMPRDGVKKCVGHDTLKFDISIFSNLSTSDRWWWSRSSISASWCGCFTADGFLM